jgi:hypothetical protein
MKNRITKIINKPQQLDWKPIVKIIKYLTGYLTILSETKKNKIKKNKITILKYKKYK